MNLFYNNITTYGSSFYGRSIFFQRQAIWICSPHSFIGIRLIYTSKEMLARI